MSSLFVRQAARSLRHQPSAFLANAQPLRSFHASTNAREHFLNADPSTFEEKVLQNGDPGKLVLVDFYADWCGPCKTLSPILERVTANRGETDGKEVDLVTIDTDVHAELAQRYQVRALPTVTAFKNGKPLGHFLGAIPEPKLKEVIKDWLDAKPE